MEFGKGGDGNQNLDHSPRRVPDLGRCCGQDGVLGRERGEAGSPVLAKRRTAGEHLSGRDSSQVSGSRLSRLLPANIITESLHCDKPSGGTFVLLRAWLVLPTKDVSCGVVISYTDNCNDKKRSLIESLRMAMLMLSIESLAAGMRICRMKKKHVAPCAHARWLTWVMPRVSGPARPWSSTRRPAR